MPLALSPSFSQSLQADPRRSFLIGEGTRLGEIMVRDGKLHRTDESIDLTFHLATSSWSPAFVRAAQRQVMYVP
jgi:hypothetical protein